MINDVNSLISRAPAPARTRPAGEGDAASFTQAFARASENRARAESQPAGAPPARKTGVSSKPAQAKQPEKTAAPAQPQPQAAAPAPAPAPDPDPAPAPAQAPAQGQAAAPAQAGQSPADQETDAKPAVASDTGSDPEAASAQATPTDPVAAVQDAANPPAADAGTVAQAAAAILAITQAIDPTVQAVQAVAAATLAAAAAHVGGTAARVTDSGVAPGQKPARDTRTAAVAVAATTAPADSIAEPAATATLPAAPTVQPETGPVARSKSTDAKAPAGAARDSTAVLAPAADAVGPRLLPVIEKPILDAGFKAVEHKADTSPLAGTGQAQAVQPGAIGPINGQLDQPSVPSAPVVSTIHSPVNSPAFGQELFDRVSTFIANGIERADIIVTPKDLGPVRIELTLSGDDARMVFTAAHPDTRQAIEQSAPLLRSMLAEQGVSLGQLDVGHGGASQHHDRTLMAAETGTNWRTSSAGTAAAAAGVARIRQGLLDLFA